MKPKSNVTKLILILISLFATLTCLAILVSSDPFAAVAWALGGAISGALLGVIPIPAKRAEVLTVVAVVLLFLIANLIDSEAERMAHGAAVTAFAAAYLITRTSKSFGLPG